MNDLRAEFDRLETNGYLGNPAGTEAYAYLRASSERQVADGSSFTRQIENIHTTASRNNLRVPFDLIFFDDDNTGFEFEHRPALLRLHYEVRTSSRANHLVIEDIDRLSRNADWQQGFLLEEFGKQDIEIHFYIHPGSALERYIRGYMAQEEMKKAKERMKMGNIYKAMDGKVTAKRPRYGYVITKDNQYELHPEESKVMRWAYEEIIYRGATLYQIAKELNDRGIPTRFKTSFWTATTLYRLVKSEVYKGEFYANRHYAIKTGEYDENGRAKTVMKERPKSEWILVPVPAIVTPEEWDLAQETMARNATRSTRNSKKREWLLSGCLLKCAICKEFCFVCIIGGTPKTRIRYYGCNSRASEKSKGLGTACFSPYVKADEIEWRVWEELQKLIYDPSIVTRRLEEKNHEEHVLGYEEQLAFIDRSLDALAKERQKFEAAYQRDIYTLDEFEEKMKDLRARENTLQVSRTKIEAKIAESHSVEEKKQVVIRALGKLRKRLERAQQNGQPAKEIPFQLKRKILTLLVDAIWVNSEERTFRIDGEIKGAFALDTDGQESPLSPISDSERADFGFTSSRKWQ